MKGVTIEDALRHTGGFGRWQRKVIIMYQGIMSIGAIALYPMTFYELQPVYLCKNRSDVGAEWETCKTEDFCGKEAEIEYRVDEENSLSLDNWVEEYGMTCSPNYQMGLFGSLFFIAVVVASFLFTPLADKFGRRKVCLFGLALACFA